MPDVRTGLVIVANARGFEGEVKRARRAQNELNKEFREAQRDARGLNRNADRLGKSLDRLTDETRANAGAMGHLKQRTDGAERATGGLLKRLFAAHGPLIRYAGFAALALSAQQFAAGVIDAGVAYEGLESRLLVGTGTTQLAAQEIEFLRSETERLGLNFRASATAYSGFLAAARGTRLEGEAARRIFRGVGEAARVMNLSAADTQGVFTAIEQIVSKGVVSAEELRGQLGERLPRAFESAARAMGVTSQELDGMLRRGELLAEDLLPKLAEELRAMASPSLTEATGGAAADFERMGNAIERLQIAIANAGVLDWLGSVSRGATGAANALAELFEPDALPDVGAQLERLYAERAQLGARNQRQLSRGGGTAALARNAESIARLTRLLPENLPDTIAALRSELAATPATVDSGRNRGANPRIAQLEDEIELAEALLELRQELNAPPPATPEAQRTFGPTGIATDAGDEFAHVQAALRTEIEKVNATYEHQAEVIRASTAAGSAAQDEGLRRAEAARGAALEQIEARNRDRRERFLSQLQPVEVDGDAHRQRLADTLADIDAEAARRRIQAQRAQREQELLEAQGFNSREEALEEAHQRTLLAVRTRYLGGEHRRLLVAQADAELALKDKQQTELAQILIGSSRSILSQLGQHNRHAFRLAQAAGIAQAVINTQQGITKALSEGGPLLGPVFAALHAAQGAAAIATIRAQRPPQAFQRGGIVDSPTFFTARNVPRGVAGEAGIEAILPLRRGPGGRLGVEASAGRSVSIDFRPRVEIRVDGGVDPEAAERAARRAGRELEGQFEAVLAKHLRPGGMLNRLDTA